MIPKVELLERAHARLMIARQLQPNDNAIGDLEVIRELAQALTWLPIELAPHDREIVVLFGSRLYGNLAVANWSNGKWLQHGVELFNVTHWLDDEPRPRRRIPPIHGKTSKARL